MAVVAVALLGVVAAASFFYFANSPQAASPAKTGPKPMVQAKGIVALGRLEPEAGIVNVSAPMGDRLAQLFVKEGDQISAGQKLAELHSKPLYEAQRALALANLEEAKRRLAAVRRVGEAMVREAELQLETAEKVEPLDLKAQEAKVRLLENQLATARKNLQRLEDLELKSVSEQQFDAQRLAVQQSLEELTAAQAILEKLKAGQKSKVAVARARLASAQAQLERATAEIPIASLQRTLAQAEERLKTATIVAPSAGRILEVRTRPGEATGHQPIVRLADTSKMVAIAEVYETDVQFVKMGATAKIESPALPQPLTGQVTYIGNIVKKNTLFELDPTAAADHRVVEVRISIAQPQTAARFVNLQVKVTIAK